MRGVKPIKEVIYQVDESGYAVAVMEEGRILEEYMATNNPWDSQGPVVTDGVPLETLQRWAEETAWEMAERWDTELVAPDRDGILGKEV